MAAARFADSKYQMEFGKLAFMQLDKTFVSIISAAAKIYPHVSILATDKYRLVIAFSVASKQIAE
jgi:hypothetical protein